MDVEDHNELMKRFWRKLIAGLGAIMLLFAQLAVAAYACPTPNHSQKSAITEVAAAFDAKPCHNMDQAQANLCKQHCEQSSQSVDTTPVHVTIDAPVLPLITFIMQIDVHLPQRMMSSPSDSPHHDGDPPLAIRNCCFRI
jgi:hypothetical protein